MYLRSCGEAGPMLTCRSLGGLPKKTQTFFFFRIDKDRQAAVTEFRQQLVQIADLITTNAQSKGDHERINERKKKGEKGLLTLSGVNIAFSQKGLTTVRCPHYDS